MQLLQKEKEKEKDCIRVLDGDGCLVNCDGFLRAKKSNFPPNSKSKPGVPGFPVPLFLPMIVLRKFRNYTFFFLFCLFIYIYIYNLEINTFLIILNFIY